MCGLVGAFRADNAMFDHKIKNFMEKGLYVSAVRGVEGTGVGIVDKNFVPGHAKTQFDAATFLQTRQYGFAKNAMLDARVILGHTRHSTVQGSISQENAHPFQWRNKENEILFTHNGHINNAHSLSHKDFHHAVDSAHVANALLHNPDIDILERMQGFYVCIWYDKQTHTVKMARNNSRDLYYVYNKAKTQIYYASEAEILKFILDREEISSEDEFHEIEPGELLIWDLEAKTLADPKKVAYKEKKFTPHWQKTAQEVGTGTFPTTSSGASGTGGSSWGGGSNVSRLGVYDPVGPARQHDTIFMDVKDFDKGFMSNGARIGYTAAEPHPEDWGFLYGSRKRQSGSICKMQIQRKQINELLVFIKDEIPVCVNKAELQTSEDGVKLAPQDHYWLYEVTLMMEKARLIKFRKEKAAREVIATEAAKGTAATEVSDPLADGSSIDPTTQIKEGQQLVPFGGVATSLDLVPGPGPGNKITRKDWLMMAEMGCFFCQGQIVESDIGRVAFYAWPTHPEDHTPDATDHQIICPTCKVDCALGKDELTVTNSHNFGSGRQAL